MTNETKTASWASLKDGSWGLRVPGGATEGEVVKCVTKGGKATYETVGKIVFTGEYGGTAYVLAVLGPKPEKKKKAPKKRSPKAAPAKVTEEYIDYDTAEAIYGSSNDLPY